MTNDLILVVEDDHLQQRLFAVLAKRSGVEIHIVGGGEDALAALQLTNNYAVIFMDWKMMDMDGLECTRRIRELEVGTDRHIPIVAITAHSRDDSEKDCLAAGMDDFLCKPFSLEQFEAMIRRFCKTNALSNSE